MSIASKRSLMRMRVGVDMQYIFEIEYLLDSLMVPWVGCYDVGSRSNQAGVL